MARPLSEEKREAILASAATAVAMLGTGAPTARIARDAGLSEGTLFNYFATKDELLNQLYLDIKADLAQAMHDAFPASGSLRSRSQHMWNSFIDWGAREPMKRKAMQQLRVSEKVTEASKREGAAAFHDITALLEESFAEGKLKDRSSAFVGALLEALAETTLEFMTRDPMHRDDYKRSGFEFFWNGVTG